MSRPEATYASTGVPGLDEILQGGWPTARLHLVLGQPGAGKTTLGLQFLLEGVARGERALYVSLSETREEVEQVAASHGWSLEGMELFELDAAGQAVGGEARSMFDPAEVELRQTSQSIVDTVERLRPSRVVFDSLAELQLMAGSSLVFRRELLALKRLLMKLGATGLLMSDSSAARAELDTRASCTACCGSRTAPPSTARTGAACASRSSAARAIAAAITTSASSPAGCASTRASSPATTGR